MNVVDRGIPERPAQDEPAALTGPDAVDEREPVNGETAPPTGGGLELPGEMRAEGGTIWWLEGCRVRALDVGSGSVRESEIERCRIWPAPSDSRALAVAEDRSEAFEGRGLVVLQGQELLALSFAGHTPGFILGEAAWSPDGARVAVCVATRAGSVLDLVSTRGGGSESIPGACHPAYLPDGRLAVVRGTAGVEIEGRTVLDEKGAAELLPTLEGGAERVVTAIGAGPERLALGVSALARQRLLPFEAAIAVVDDEGDVDFSAHLPADVLPTSIGLSPRGDAIWYHDAGSASATIIGIPGGRRHLPFDARWVGWSPSGAYLLAALPDAIVVSSWPGRGEIARIPVDAAYVAWMRSS